MRVITAISKLTLGVLFISAFAVTSATAAPAKNVAKNAEVKYLGMSNDAVIFDVSFENPTGTKFIVTVLDEDGNEIFRAGYSDKKFDKKFELPIIIPGKLTFVISGSKDVELKQSFEINTHEIENVVVTKI
jgi:hypothetical protein